jgi:hypothetical protein
MQKTVESSTYGSELVAARIATDTALELRYNVRMMGFGLDGPVNMFGDNQSAILNTTIPSSQLKKKIHACAYHRIREMIICRAIRFIHCQSDQTTWRGSSPKLSESNIVFLPCFKKERRYMVKISVVEDSWRRTRMDIVKFYEIVPGQ